LDVEHFLLPLHWGRFCGQRRCGLAQFLLYDQPEAARIRAPARESPRDDRFELVNSVGRWFGFTTQLHRQILGPWPREALAKPNQDTIKDHLLSVTTSDRTKHSTSLALEACSPADTICTAQNSFPVTMRSPKPAD